MVSEILTVTLKQIQIYLELEMALVIMMKTPMGFGLHFHLLTDLMIETHSQILT